MEQQQNYQMQMEQKAAENARRIEALAREKVAERIREADQKREADYSRQRQDDDRRRAEAARKRDREQQELRAKAREEAKKQAAEMIKKEVEKAKERQQETAKEPQMHGASQGPTMRPSSGDKQRDALEMMVEMDHPGLTDAQKAAVQQRYGVQGGEGFQQREAERNKPAEARESRKTAADKAQDQTWFRQGIPYEQRQSMERERDKKRIMQIEQAHNQQMKAQQQQKVQVKAPERLPEKAQAKVQKAPQPYEFARDPDEHTNDGRH
ncbi:MAG: hypothetical protein M0Z50_09820 [Planctomycetia bacterium]|nr:hypothetical protein [Planctomycetia bacterium]